jgi:SWI/SNF-related matrix-associated actin-dependent regulator 1 of chromatin subfamily A
VNLTKTNTPIPCPKGSKAFQPTGTGKLWINWTTPGAEWRRILEIVKRLPDRRWNGDLKLWEVPDTADARSLLLYHGFQLLGGSSAPVAIGMPGVPAKQALAPWVPPWKDVEIPDLGIAFRPYQIEGLQMLRYRNGRGGLFLDMGTGKSLTALGWVKLNQDFERVVVIATSSTKTQWPREAKKWGIQMPFWVLSGRTPHGLPKKGAVVLNWDILEAWTDALVEWNPQTVIADEVQAVGNPKAKRSKAFLKLTDNRGVVALSGTPARTCPAQLYTVLHALDPKTFPDHWRYLNRYCDPKSNGFSTTYKGSTHAEELHGKIRPLGIRYTKDDVLKDLPDRVYTPVLMDCTMSDEYQEAQDRILGMQGYSPGQIRERLGALTASAFEMKKDAVIDWIADFLATGEKLVVFGWHIAVLDYLEMHLGKQCVRVSGGVSKDARELAVRRFVNDDACKVFLGNIQAAGVGIDGLQAACSNVAFVELCWSPADLDQAESRLHRLGQKSSVNVYFLLAAGTIDTVMAEALESRKNALRVVVDGKTETNEDESIVAMVRNLTTKEGSK